MKLSNLFNLVVGRPVSSDETALSNDTAANDSPRLATAGWSEPMIIDGTSTELYDSHNFEDLGVYFEAVDFES